jgi:transcriptional regulator with XRE-family HTH domain
MTFGEKFRRARRVADLTQRQIADALGVSTVFVSRIETGHAKFPADRISVLPPPLQAVVIDAMIEESQARIERLQVLRQGLRESAA